MKGVSVVICCYNSEKRLSPTIKHLAEQNVPDYIMWEVIVVDNNSTDNTAKIVRSLWSGYKISETIRLRVVNENRAGLSHARTRGMTEASFDLICFVDDDNWLNKDYLAIVYEIMTANPCIGVLGGVGVAECEINSPEWFTSVKENYAVGKQSNVSGDISEKRGYVYGAGFVLKREILQKLASINYSSSLTDRRENKLSAGGDSELCYLTRLAGYLIWYDERLTFKHFIPKERLRWEYYKKLIQGFGEARFYLEPYRIILKGGTKNYVGKNIVWLIEFWYSLYYLIQTFIFTPFSKDRKALMADLIYQASYCKMLLIKNYTFDKNLEQIYQLQHHLLNR
ncbi:glycosyltransferase [Rhodocytophaga aerolata]|uniref:Glycosyltransferase n=1 Tax=Rhodocytophaga aerolata TaxID=455078 RepID=A0ABT8RAX9_9BACT|nr:glycosyltransferase [Rhodocytophaga aerolata]MDO1448841.1 glycosyltransferase [Rhodocytophaga aerolata]